MPTFRLVEKAWLFRVTEAVLKHAHPSIHEAQFQVERVLHCLIARQFVETKTCPISLVLLPLVEPICYLLNRLSPVKVVNDFLGL